ncbi:MAG: YegP family protein, partial [Oscillospiraceae bacterium]
KQTATGFTFHLKASNGEIIATSEVYSGMEACENGIESVRKNAPIAAIEEQLIANFTEEKCPKFELYLDKSGEYRFRLKAHNGQKIAASEGYKSKEACANGIASVR